MIPTFDWGFDLRICRNLLGSESKRGDYLHQLLRKYLHQMHYAVN